MRGPSRPNEQVWRHAAPQAVHLWSRSSLAHGKAMVKAYVPAGHSSASKVTSTVVSQFGHTSTLPQATGRRGEVTTIHRMPESNRSLTADTTRPLP